MTKWLLVHRTAVSGRSAMRSRSAGLVASILIVDDHAAIRRAFAWHLSASPDLRCAEEAEDGFDAIGKPQKLSPDLIVLVPCVDASDGRSGGCAGVEETVSANPA